MAAQFDQLKRVQAQLQGVDLTKLDDIDLSELRRAVGKDLTTLELAEFARRGLAAFWDCDVLGKHFRLPRSASLEAVGRLVGALRAALGSSSIKEVYKDTLLGVDDFRASVRGHPLYLVVEDLADDDLDSLVAVLERSGGQVDIRELAAFVRRSMAVFDDVDRDQKDQVAHIAAETKIKVEAARLQRRLDELHQGEERRADEARRRTRLKKPPIRPRPSDVLFGWLPDSTSTRARLLSDLRDALRLHEDQGNTMAAATTLVLLARRLVEAPLDRYSRRDANEPCRYACAGDSFVRAEHLLRAELGDGHITCIRTLVEAAQAYAAGDAANIDKAKRTLQRARGLLVALPKKDVELSATVLALQAKIKARQGADTGSVVKDYEKAIALVDGRQVAALHRDLAMDIRVTAPDLALQHLQKAAAELDVRQQLTLWKL